MKSVFLVLVSVFLTFQSTFGAVFSYHVEVEADGDFVSDLSKDEVEESGWSIESDDWDSYLTIGKRNVGLEGKRSIVESIGDIEFVISQTKRGAYKACLGISVGDFDSSADGCTYLHPGVNVLYASGGDHASGAWGFDGKAVIHLK